MELNAALRPADLFPRPSVRRGRLFLHLRFVSVPAFFIRASKQRIRPTQVKRETALQQFTEGTVKKAKRELILVVEQKTHSLTASLSKLSPPFSFLPFRLNCLRSCFLLA